VSPSLKGGGEGGRRGGEGSPGAPSLVARPESGEGWVALDCLGAAGSRTPPSSDADGKCGGLKSVMEQMTEGFGCSDGKGSDDGGGADGEGGEGNWGCGVVHSVGSYLFV